MNKNSQILMPKLRTKNFDLMLVQTGGQFLDYDDTTQSMEKILQEMETKLKAGKGYCGMVYFQNPNHLSGRCFDSFDIAQLLEFCFYNRKLLFIDESQQFVNTSNFTSAV